MITCKTTLYMHMVLNRFGAKVVKRFEIIGVFRFYMLLIMKRLQIKGEV